MRSAKYVSASTASLTVVITPSGGTAQPALSFPCTTASCTATFGAPVGNDTIALSLTDTSSNALSLTTSTPLVVQPNITNTVNLTANPVVASVAVQLGAMPASSISTNAGATATVPVSVIASDADGNQIVGPGSYVDSAGNPVTLTLSVANMQAGGSGSVTLSNNTVSSPSDPAITAQYNGKWLASSTVSVSSSSPLITSLTPASLTTTPQSFTYTGGVLPGAYYQSITAGSDGNVWANDLVNGALLKMSTAGVGQDYVATGFPPGWVGGYDTLGPDGNIYFTAFGDGIGRVTPSGAFTYFTPPASGGLDVIVPGPGGSLWFSEENSSYLGEVTTAGAVSNYPLTLINPRGVGAGPDGNLWLVSGTTFTLARVTPTGAETDFPYTVPWSGGEGIDDNNDGVVAGSDGNIWFITADEQGIGRCTTGGTNMTFFQVGSNAFVTGLVLAPDGNVWFVANGDNSIGRITPAGVITEFPLPGGTNNYGIAVGPDGNIWTAGSSVTKFIY